MWHRVRDVLKGPPRLEVYTDGSAAARAGRPGGWAFAFVRFGEVLLTAHGAAPATTSLAMELEAATRALEALVSRRLHETHLVELISDSSITLEIARGTFVPKKLEARAAALRALALETRAHTRWVRAHDGHAWNELVDALALEAKLKS